MSCGNKSELAVGYCTLYGDLSGGLGVISDVPKTRIYEIARYINRTKEILPWNILNKAPSAELKPAQTDQDVLPPYEDLDIMLKEYIEEGQTFQHITKSISDEETVKDTLNRVLFNEYKRKQAPPGLKITTKAFGYGRRYPIAHRFKF